MTPEEKAIIEWAREWRRHHFVIAGESTRDDMDLARLVDALEPQLEWVSATFLMCLAGDRIRIGQEETGVLRSSSGTWNVNTSDYWHPRPWVHTELRMDLTANPGFREYPPSTPCEILMSPERKAVHLLMQTFPGSQIVS